ncbi:cytochrome c-type biogenesis protein CcmH [Albidovulum sediminicola]|uniref:Cytochrome c-type biogenesis protein n=1 Tax=Albidovulum sediminicola TaxID=2984331 RepID=A0ABT2Z0Q7_9RHOB|nr:cytochrome c-type biogenesis protein [Defluviimonas sp. WL0075]MCV2864665.1 cytochrome c-type biogenesis protein CcmH [Defluviimonas sp. WL0075]
MKRILLAFFLLATPVLAVQPDEILSDPALEARAREISAVLRCPVCQGETIDDSNAPVARDLRLVVRERVVAGDTDAQVIDYVVQRFGEFVLFEPQARGANIILWVAGPVMLLIALMGAALYLRRRGAATEAAPTPLDEDESRRLKEILKE